MAKEIKNKCLENNIKDIIFLGDFFHDRKNINSKTLWIANEFVEILKDFNIYMVIGNHDTYLKNDLFPHSLKSLQNFPHVTIIDNILEINEYLTLISWNQDLSNVCTPNIAGHFDIAECEISSNFTESKETLKISDLKKFKNVLSGHFHSPNKTNNIFYIGSVMPFTFADIDSKRGYYIFTFNDNMTYDFFEFESAPKYKKIFSIDEFTKNDIENNVIKLVYKTELSSIESENILSKIWSFNPIHVYADFKNMETIDDSKPINENLELKDSIGLLYDYIEKDKVPEYINKKTLKLLLNQLIKGE